MLDKLDNPFLKLYLEYVEETESPRIMHLWSILSGISACLGRRLWFPFGTGSIFPNTYVLLVGPPGVRKSTAINIASNLVRSATDVRFAPSDTGGERQGLIISMENEKGDDEKEDEKLMNAVVNLDIDYISNMDAQIDPRNKHCMYIVASEFTSFIGLKSMTMITFLNKMYDGEDYDYKISSRENTLRNPLLNLIGGTTPSDISDSLPAPSIGKGFTSRIVFVYANRKYKRVAFPPPLDNDIAVELKKTLSWAFYQMEGEIGIRQEAKKLLEKLYEKRIDLDDIRFIYYAERRFTHLIKLSMLLAALRQSSVIDVKDVQEALLILEYTEQFMPEALGEFGLSPVSAAKQKMVEFLQHANGPVSEQILWGHLNKDMKLSDFRNSLAELQNGSKILKVHANAQVAYVYRDAESEELVELLGGEKLDGG